MNDPLYPILEFDRESEEIFRPPYSPIDIPERCVLPIYAEVVRELCDRGVLTRKARLKWEIGSVPVYVMDHKGTRITVANPGAGAPLAAGVMEELIALGCRKFIACGAAGRLVGGIPAGAIVAADSAVRDEGTSYHYLPPNREIAADPTLYVPDYDTLPPAFFALEFRESYGFDSRLLPEVKFNNQQYLTDRAGLHCAVRPAGLVVIFCL